MEQAIWARLCGIFPTTVYGTRATLCSPWEKLSPGDGWDQVAVPQEQVSTCPRMGNSGPGVGTDSRYQTDSDGTVCVYVARAWASASLGLYEASL